MSKSALILVDIQNDFLPGGSLAVTDGDQILKPTNALIKQFCDSGDLVIATQDWHPVAHKSFASQHPGKSVYDLISLNGLDQVLWPDHCVENTPGAEFSDELLLADWIVCKGEDPEVDSYSGFFDNGKKNSTQLDAILRKYEITNLTICGLAYDYCVKYTALDALALGYSVTIPLSATKAVMQSNWVTCSEILAQAGAKLIV